MKLPQINFSKQARQLERLITDNSPMILTALGVVGTLGTAVLTWKAATDAEQMIQAHADSLNLTRGAEDDWHKRSDFDNKQKFQLTWKCYIAPVSVGAFTVASIIGAQKINARRAAALAGVLAMTQEDIKEYKAKVQEKLTGPKQKEVREELAKNDVDRAVDKYPTINVPDGRVLCVESWTKRPFTSEYNKLLQAENGMNRKILKEDSASLSDFYDMLGIDHTDGSDDYGWNKHGGFEIDIVPVETSDHRPAFSVVYTDSPIFKPHQF